MPVDTESQHIYMNHARASCAVWADEPRGEWVAGAEDECSGPPKINFGDRCKGLSNTNGKIVGTILYK